MSDLLHWYARIHGPRGLRIARAALSGELDRERADAASGPQDGMAFPEDDYCVADQPDRTLDVSTRQQPRQ